MIIENLKTQLLTTLMPDARLADMPRLERQALLMALQGGIDEQTD